MIDQFIEKQHERVNNRFIVSLAEHIGCQWGHSFEGEYKITSIGCRSFRLEFGNIQLGDHQSGQRDHDQRRDVGEDGEKGHGESGGGDRQTDEVSVRGMHVEASETPRTGETAKESASTAFSRDTTPTGS